MADYAIADLHFGDGRLARQRNFNTAQEHDEWLIHQWNTLVTPADHTYIVGDVAAGEQYIELISRLAGTKTLILGNHDTYPIETYLKYVSDVRGVLLLSDLNIWLSHIPMHVDAFRSGLNVHGHLHGSQIKSPDYLCVSVEQRRGIPIDLNLVKPTKAYCK